jgi:hypothetical protein
MRHIRLALLVLLAPVAVLAYDPGSAVFDAGGGGGASIGDGVTSGTGDILNAYDYANPTALTGDSALNVGTSIQGGTHASPFATTAARLIGGPLVLSGGIGTTGCSAVAGAACAGDTVTVTVTDTTGTALAGVVLTDGGNWTHSDTAATNATNLAAAITAHASLSPYVTASASTAAMGIAVKPGKAIALTIATSDAACCTVVNGADGVVLVPPGTAAAPGWAFANDTDNGMYMTTTANRVGFVNGGAEAGYYEGGNWTFTGSMTGSGNVRAHKPWLGQS